MVSTCKLQEKYHQVQRNFCFYLDILDSGISRTISKRIEDLGLQQEYFLTARVTHVVRSGGAAGVRWPPRDAPRSRADAMIQRVPPETRPREHTNRVTLDLKQAVILLDKIYDTFFSAPSKANIRLFRKHFIKIEFLDKLCRPVYKEFDEWPHIQLEPDPPREKKEVSPIEDNLNNNNLGQKMTRKSRPRIKEREDKEAKGGYCEMCNAEYADAARHAQEPHHLAFVKDHQNYLALDELIGSTQDVSAFLDKATPINGERRSLRNACNGDIKKSKRSQSPDSTVNGNDSPKRNGVDDEKKHNTRCSKKNCDVEEKDRQYYKVVSTKLRSSGGFVTKEPKKEPLVNGTSKPLVVKFRKIRRSELSVLSDEAEQFMFPKRASSTSSTSSDEEEERPKSKSPKSPPQPPATLERRRVARPMALKEESSEDDSWPEDKRRRKRQPPVVKVRRLRKTASAPEPAAEPGPAPPPAPQPQPEEPPPDDISPLREEPSERCMTWEGGRLQYSAGVERLEFSFESVPRAEPWYRAFDRQDQAKTTIVRDLPSYFSLYSKSPKLPYEIGTLPPLKPNCCPLSDLVRSERAAPRAYGTRGNKKQKIKKRTLALLALESHPRKSPREHASTLAMLGATGRRVPDSSEDTASETASTKPETAPAVEDQDDAADKLQQFLSDVFSDAADLELSDCEGSQLGGDAPDLPRLVAAAAACTLLHDHLTRITAAPARGPRRRPNRTGWPAKKRVKKEGSSRSTEDPASSTASEPDPDPDPHPDPHLSPHPEPEPSPNTNTDEDDAPLQAEVEEPPRSRRSVNAASASAAWMQPVVRVARVEGGPRLRSAAAPAPARPRHRPRPRARPR